MTSHPLFVEPLEPRIAPAILVQGGNLLGAKFGPTTGETSAGGNTVTLIQVLSGSALVFYDGSNVTSISVGPDTKLDLTGSVGDIVTNLDANGRLTDSNANPGDGEDGGILLPSNIKGITTHALGSDPGSIGRIIAGGDVKHLTTSDENATIGGLYAGDGVFRNADAVTVSTGAVDFNTIQPGAQTNFVLHQADGVFKPGASIKGAKISIGQGLEVFAGGGKKSPDASGGAGGGIVGVDVVKSFASQGSQAAIYLYAGDGGSGTSGGAGGSISGFTDEGSTMLVKVQTGHGGQGLSGSGGAGGSFLSSTVTTKSPAYQFIIGDGGDGSGRGGDGGTVKGLAFTSNITTSEQLDASGARSSGTLIATGDFNGDGLNDIVIVNATSGDAVVSVAGGPGGAYLPVTQLDGSPYVSPVGLTASDLVTGDFNGDGRLDFAVSYAGSNNIGVFINHGDGVFDPSQVSVSKSPYRLVAGDFVGSAATDLAYLALPGTVATGSTATSRVYVVQNDGLGHFTQNVSSTSIAGVASDLIAAPIDGDAHADIFVSLSDNPGTVEAFLASSVTTGAPFNLSATILTGAAFITNLDAVALPTGLRLLAFSSDVTGSNALTNPDATAGAPALKLLTINASGHETANTDGSAVASSTLAHFVGAAGDYGVLTPTSVQVTSLDGNASKSYNLADGRVTNFAALGADASDSIAAVGAIPTRFFVSDGNNLDPFILPLTPQLFSFTGGSGGHGGSLSGGKGGNLRTITFTETLDGGADSSGGSYTVSMLAGNGGLSDGGTGGAGGNLNQLVIKVDPADTIAGIDDTTLLKMHAGAGGKGVDGGKGGEILGLTATALFDEVSNNGVRLNSFAADLEAGAGGVGSQGHGGAGGAVTLNGASSLTGVSFYDPDSPFALSAALSVVGGAGGQGATFGGAGGAVGNVGSQNAPLGGGASLATTELTSASLVAGHGGDGANGAGGKGGDIISANASVQARAIFFGDGSVGSFGGSVTALAGDGGNSIGAVGGAGGVIKTSTLASVQGDRQAGFGVLAAGGNGGNGTAGGGNGGSIQTLTINSPSDPTLYAAALFGGDGGAALGSGLGGSGGAIKGVTQTKDVNSSINVMVAGDGGAGGGVGGKVKKIDTVGFIGSPNSAVEARLGAFNGSVTSPAVASFFAGSLVPQGIFAGRGEGGNGSVSKVVARQIAAVGAAPDGNNLFGVASSVSNLQADLIGYDTAPGPQETFDSTAGGHVSPRTAVPIDGFILAAAVSAINTSDNARTAEYTFLG